MKFYGQNISRGYTLIEVLVGILIFAVGMMALAQLQSHLARNSTDANARTVASNIAEELIEQVRTFRQIESGVDAETGLALAAYNDITADELSRTLTREGNSYTVVADVTDYYYDFETKTFTATQPTGVAKSDFKRVDLTVTWNDGQEFYVDQETTTDGRLGSGSIQVSEVISSITSASAGKVALNATGDSSYSPEVDYNPGQNPDVVSISLGANKFKESTTPQPDVIRTDELVETRFDVITYSQDNAGATFLRREEFMAISCECTLKIPSADGGEGGLRPTIWNGEEYTEAEFVDKPYGVSANNQQSPFCDLCCRDHHDGGSGSQDIATDPGSSLYNPFRSSSSYYGAGDDSFHADLIGDHQHYHRDTAGDLVLAKNDGDAYVEACRMVRKDGFFRVAQDLRQEGLNAFPANFLDDADDVSMYSGYVTTAVSKFEGALNDGYETSPPSMETPDAQGLSFPASTVGNASLMSVYLDLTEQQLRSRGIYIDYMSDDLRCKIDQLVINNGIGDCEVPENVSSPLEIIPFYDVQLTWLSTWTETPSNDPVDVSNERVLSENQHSRGFAVLGDGYGPSTVNSAVHSGNLGLTSTDPIDPGFRSELADYELYIESLDPTSAPAGSGVWTIGEIISAVPGVKATDVDIDWTGAQCDRTVTGFECEVLEGANNPTLKVYNYFKNNRELLACSSNESLLLRRDHSLDNPSENYAIFKLPTEVSIDVTIVIQEGSSCAL